MTDVLPLLNRMAAAPSIDAAWDLATGYFASLGFQRVNYGFTRFRHLKTIGDPEDALFLSTCDADYIKRYFQGGFYARTPVFRWAERNSGICTWAWVRAAHDAGRLSADEAEAVRQNAAMGVTAGISVSFPEVSARLTIVHLPKLSRHRALSPRQCEALEWVADGKTTQDVALLMGVSPAMVEKHLRLAREALAVETTAQAVAKAALLNMIFQRLPETAAQAAR